MGSIVFIQGGTLVASPVDPNIPLAMGQLALALIQIKKYKKEYSRASKNMKKGLDFLQEVSDWYHQYYVNYYAPALQEAVVFALAYEVPVNDPEKFYRETRAILSTMLGQQEQVRPQLLDGSLDTKSNCDKRIDIASAVAMASASTAQLGRGKIDSIEGVGKKMSMITTALDAAQRENRQIYQEAGEYIKGWNTLLNISTGGLNGALTAAGSQVGVIARELAGDGRAG